MPVTPPSSHTPWPSDLLFPPQPFLVNAGHTCMLDPKRIESHPWLPRHTPSALAPHQHRLLLATIAHHGLPAHFVVRPLPGSGRYQLLCDDPRLPVVITAGLNRVPAISRCLSDRYARILALHDNLFAHTALHFLDQADALAGLLQEGFSLAALAAALGKPVAWAARRLRLHALTPDWRQLAAHPQGWSANWSAEDFEQIAQFAPQAQTDLLQRDSHRLQQCTTFHQLRQLLRSLALPIATFPWAPDDPGLLPTAGPCTACPYRTSQFDHPTAQALHASGAHPPHPATAPVLRDRCLNPSCAARKASAFLTRLVAQLAASHPRVLLLRHGAYPCDVAGALREWDVREVAAGTPGALPAVIANGPHLGTICWVLPATGATPALAGSSPLDPATTSVPAAQPPAAPAQSSQHEPAA